MNGTPVHGCCDVLNVSDIGPQHEIENQSILRSILVLLMSKNKIVLQIR
jgi:hypothetical protein